MWRVANLAGAITRKLLSFATLPAGCRGGSRLDSDSLHQFRWNDG